MVAGTVYVDYISDRNTGEPGLEDVCGPLNLDGNSLHRLRLFHVGRVPR